MVEIYIFTKLLFYNNLKYIKEIFLKTLAFSKVITIKCLVLNE